MVNAYGYVRDKFGDFSSGITIVKRMAKEVGIEIKEIYAEKSDGNYENMEIAQGIINTLKNCVLFVPDTSDLYFDDYAMVNFSKKLNENNVLLVDCSFPKFDNTIICKNNGIENISEWLFSKTIIVLERYKRASIDTENKSRESDIKSLALKIESMKSES